MEAATKKKRGRPTVDEQTGLGMVDFIQKADNGDHSHRQHVNTFYVTVGTSFIEQYINAIPHADEVVQLYNGTYIRRKTGRAILEQLGRMLNRDGYSEDDVQIIADRATAALANGASVKLIERWIRHGRTTGRFEPLEAASEITFTDQEAVDAYMYLDVLVTVLRRESEHRTDVLSDYNIDFPVAIEIAEQLRNKFEPKYQQILTRQKGEDAP